MGVYTAIYCGAVNFGGIVYCKFWGEGKKKGEKKRGKNMLLSYVSSFPWLCMPLKLQCKLYKLMCLPCFHAFFSSGILVSSKQTTLPQGEDLTLSLVITVQRKIIGTIQMMKCMDGD